MKKVGLFLLAIVMSMVAFAQDKDTIPLSHVIDTIGSGINEAISTIPAGGSPLTDYLTWVFVILGAVLGMYIYFQNKVISGLRKNQKNNRE